MLSRTTTKVIANLYREEFTTLGRIAGNITSYVDTEKLYDYLYERDYEAWFCNLMRSQTYPRTLEEFIMKLHTGESQASATESWTWDQRRDLGQRVLLHLAAGLLERLSAPGSSPYRESERKTGYQNLLRSIELDGYAYRNGSLLHSEADVLDVQEEHGVLVTLYTELALAAVPTMKQHLDKSEEHYIAGSWSDSISNSRSVLEQTFREIAAAHCIKTTGVAISKAKYGSPKDVREYLQAAGLLIEEEKRGVAGVYGFLSHTGSHPYMAEQDQARLLRHLALTIAQFVMLRYKGFLLKP